jgi:alpha-ketoglutarate-dependent taurine dioxygenase
MTLSTTNSSQILAQLKYHTLSPFGLLLENTNSLPISELLITELRQLIWEHRLIILRGFPLFEHDALSEYCTNFGNLLTWNFGTVLDLIVHENPQNYLFTNGNVPFHWDGAFAKAVPSFLFFQCLEAPIYGRGGESLFCDTTKIWESLEPSQRQVWKQIEITYRTEKIAHYGGDIKIPLVNQHPITHIPTLRFAEPLNEKSAPLNPLFLEISGLPPEQHELFLSELQEMLYEPQNCFAHEWQDGDILIADNHALLHGRNPFLSNSPRHLQRVHIL